MAAAGGNQEGGPGAGRIRGFAADGASSSALYVGDLDKGVDEGLLYHLFSRVGPVASIRVCRDAVTRRSLGYAYVNYNTALDPQAAQKAQENLNYTPVKGKPIRIMKAQRDPAARRSGVANVFVKGLDDEIDSRTLHDTFEVFGPITSAKVARNEMGEPLGYGYVQYDSPEAAAAAVQRANGMLLKGRPLHVAPYKDKSARGVGRGFTNLYVKSFPEDVKDTDALRALFEPYGPITSVHLAKDDAGNLKGFGFVNFESPEYAVKAMEALNGKEIATGKMYVGPAQKKVVRQKLLREKYEQMKRDRQQSTQGRNLYVKHIGPDQNDDGLRQMFEKFGTITSARVMTDDAGKSRGFGFVCFSTVDEATKAQAEMNGEQFDGLQLYVAVAQPKEVRQAELARQRMAGLGLGMANAPNPYTQIVPPGMVPAQVWPSNAVTHPYHGKHGGRYQGKGGSYRGRGGRGLRGRGSGRMHGPFDVELHPAGMKPINIGDIEGPNPPATGLGTQVLAAASPRQQKVMLGERLYPLVAQLQPDRAAKITGMLLEMDNAEILLLIENPVALQSKVDEAVTVLGEHGLLKEKAAAAAAAAAAGTATGEAPVNT
ncbi:unnamed protein product [Ostreobium quekettii]|uniref:PABP n=1 Tax=Ostreobium quekettii TaxID=121088 RepID=A0A8S1J5P5_9CHLO|nr:unnamed protein product [Ostreobium quekettii]|eukprot:evm.model.scf_357.9 EVM.evm.TU.scf_357.9   scf_357:84986-92481(-)